MYPVGSVYISASNQANPNDIFGVNIGTWVRLSGGWAYAAGAGEVLVAGGGTGGSWTHTHTYGLGWSGWYSFIHGLGGDAIEFYDNGSWNSKADSIGKIGNNINAGGGAEQLARYRSTASTGAANISSAIPWFRVAMWYRKS